MRVGIYLGDIKKPESQGDLTYELSFVDEILSQNTSHEFIFYYFGKKNIFKNQDNAKFVCLKYYKKPEISFQPLCVKFYKTPIYSLNYRLKKDNVNVMFFLKPYLHEHIETPYFAVIRDVAHRILPYFPEFNSNRVFQKKEKRLNLFLASASQIITCNDVAKNDIKTIYNVIDEKIVKMSVPCPNWLKNTIDNDLILKSNGLTKNSYIFYPAQFWSHKNHIRLILAAQVMKEQNINLKVVFSGLDRGNKKYIIKKVNSLDLNEDIIFLNYVSQKELASLYKNAYALVYPCLAGPDSIAALEAMYFNCPVLISNNLGYNQQLKKAALYFNPLDEIDIVETIKKLNDIQTRDELLTKGQLLVKELNSKQYIEKCLNMIDNFYLIRQCWSLKESYRDR